MKFSGYGCREDLIGVGGGEMIKIHCMKNIFKLKN